MHSLSLAIQVTFAVVVFVIVYCLFKKALKVQSPFKKVSFWVTSVVAAIVLYLILLKIFINLFFTFPSGNFTKEKWRDDQEKRTEIVDDLVNQKLLDGKTRSEVTELLGEPLKDNQYFSETGADMIYYLGAERSFAGVDNEWLLIWFENDKVSKSQVKTD